MKQMYLIGTQLNNDTISGITISGSDKLEYVIEGNGDQIIAATENNKYYNFEKDNVYLINFLTSKKDNTTLLNLELIDFLNDDDIKISIRCFDMNTDEMYENNYQTIFVGKLNDLKQTKKLIFTPIVDFECCNIYIEYKDIAYLANDLLEVEEDTVISICDIYELKNSIEKDKLIKQVKIEASPTGNIFMIVNEDLFLIDSTGTIIFDKNYPIYFLSCFCEVTDKIEDINNNINIYSLVEYEEV